MISGDVEFLKAHYKKVGSKLDGIINRLEISTEYQRILAEHHFPAEVTVEHSILIFHHPDSLRGDTEAIKLQLTAWAACGLMGQTDSRKMYGLVVDRVMLSRIFGGMMTSIPHDPPSQCFHFQSSRPS